MELTLNNLEELRPCLSILVLCWINLDPFETPSGQVIVRQLLIVGLVSCQSLGYKPKDEWFMRLP